MLLVFLLNIIFNFLFFKTFIIGSVDLLRFLMEHLNTSTSLSWDQIEAILFIISSFINNIVELVFI